MADSILVECHREGRRLLPTSFGRTGVEQRVATVVDAWPGADYCYFKLRTIDGGLYILRHDEPDDRWEITLFEQWESAPCYCQTMRYLRWIRVV